LGTISYGISNITGGARSSSAKSFTPRQPTGAADGFAALKKFDDNLAHNRCPICLIKIQLTKIYP
jgi:hypothetical protein